MNQSTQLNTHNKQEFPTINKSELSDNIIIYQAENGEIRLDVKINDDTVWLTQAQMSELFGRERTVIGRHIKNIFSEGELNEKLVCANFAHTTPHGAIKGKSQTRELVYYNLDVIISVGYRVKSKRGTQFRIWANKILKEYIIKGYAINQKIKLERYEELKDFVRILGKTIKNQEHLTSDQSKGLLAVVTDYVYALDTLDQYDYQQLTMSIRLKATNSKLLTRMQWKQSKARKGSSVKANYLQMRKINRSKVQSLQYTRLSVELSFIQVLKRKQPCYFI